VIFLVSQIDEIRFPFLYFYMYLITFFLTDSYRFVLRTLISHFHGNFYCLTSFTVIPIQINIIYHKLQNYRSFLVSKSQVNFLYCTIQYTVIIHTLLLTPVFMVSRETKVTFESR